MKEEKDFCGTRLTAVEGVSVSASESAIARHTEGPWFLLTAGGRIPAVREIKRPHGEASHYRAVVSTNELGGGHTIAKLDFGYGSQSDTANAHLIAAAPEMLEVLKAMLTLAPDPLGGVIDRATRQRASEVIAKAEGRS